MQPNELFVTCVPGLEPVVLDELKALGMQVERAGYGGLFVSYTQFHQVYELNLLLRTASRVLLPMASFSCRNKEDLYEGALEIEWERYFRRMPTFAIDAHTDHPAFNNSLFAAQCVKDAICDRLRKKTGQRPNVNTSDPDVRLSLFIQGSRATISFDTSGRPLHERGYRLDAGEAPIRENLAAALLMLAGYNAEAVLVDPVAGSGTFLVEAALMATKTPPQFLRQMFGFMSHPEYSEGEWIALRKRELNKRVPLKPGQFIAIENDARTFTALQRALQKAGFSNGISAICGDFRTVPLKVAPNLVIANPPYGIRLRDERMLEDLYQSLGDFMKQKTAKPARGFILSGNSELTKKIGLRASKRHIVNNGGIDCRFLEFDLY